MSDVVMQLVVNSITAGALYAIIAIGFTLSYGVGKFFNLAHGVMTAIGAYAVFYLTKGLQIEAWLAVFIAIIFTGAVGWLLERYIYAPLRARKASTMVLLVASLGAFTALQGVLSILFSSQVQTLTQGSAVQQVVAFAGATITEIQIITIITAIATLLGFVVLLRYTLFGKSVRAVSDDEEVSKIVGINTTRVIGVVFFLAAATAGLAGILVGFDTAIEPTMGMALLLKGVIAAIVGGIGNIYGAVLGALLLGFVENFGIWKIAGEWKDAIAFALLIAFLLFRPHGILNKKS
ncbi:MAG: branched-chain amino acid ABC transporter permease [Candidatus Kaiserbacteria bacterium]|nr:branched-chain amino acid ABC transporter permease [Candidatus Kaiserbacteria bacterium]